MSAFANMANVRRTYMDDFERGERNFTLKSVERIAETLGINVLEMLQG